MDHAHFTSKDLNELASAMYVGKEILMRVEAGKSIGKITGAAITGAAFPHGSGALDESIQEVENSIAKLLACEKQNVHAISVLERYRTNVDAAGKLADDVYKVLPSIKPQT